MLALAATWPGINYADGIFQAIALSGKPAPGTDSVYRSFGAASINANGDIVFPAELTGGSTTAFSRQGIWVHKAQGDMSLLVRSGQPAAGASDGRVYSSLITRIVLNDLGQIAFSSGLVRPTGGIVLDFDVWKGSDSSNLEMVAAFGQTVAGTTPPVAPDEGYGALSLNNTGILAFRSGLSNQGGEGIWRESPAGALQLLASAQDLAPNDPRALRFYEFAQWVYLNSSGETFFEVNLTDGQTYQDRRSIYSADVAGNLVRIAGPMDQIETDRGTTTVLSASAPQLSSTSSVVFRMEHLSSPGSSTSLMAWNEGSFETIAAVNDSVQVNNLAEKILSIGQHRSDRFGNVAFSGRITLNGEDSNRGGMFVCSPEGDITHMAFSGQQAPGAPPGHVFSWFGFGLNPLDFAMSGDGQVAFNAYLEDAVSREIVGQGIWLWDDNGHLSPLILRGQIIDVDDGTGTDSRSVLIAQMGGFGSTHDGLPTPFNDDGKLVVHASFGDGSTGILLIDPSAVPEPTTVAQLLFLAVIAISAARLRRPFPFAVRCE